MTRQQLDHKLMMLQSKIKVMVMQAAPRRTGNLMRSIQVSALGSNGFTIYINEGKAPYAKYTNEGWSRGTNPNEGWFDELAPVIARYIASYLGAERR